MAEYYGQRDSEGGLNIYSMYISVFILVIILAGGCCLPGLCTEHIRSKPSAVISKNKVTPSPVILNTYLEAVKKRIEHFWYPGKGTDAHAEVVFRINKDGHASCIDLTNASPISSVNHSAEDAISSSSPFAPLPASLTDHIYVVADFNSDFQPIYQISYARPIETKLSSSKVFLADAAACTKQGKIESAIENLKKASELTPFDMRVRDKLTEAYLQLAQTKPNDLAVNLFHQALLLDHDDIAARTKLNELLSSSGKDAQSVEARLALAREYTKSSSYDDALSEYGEAWLLKNDSQLIPEINLACLRRRKYAEIQRWQADLTGV